MDVDSVGSPPTMVNLPCKLTRSLGGLPYKKNRGAHRTFYRFKRSTAGAFMVS